MEIRISAALLNTNPRAILQLRRLELTEPRCLNHMHSAGEIFTLYLPTGIMHGVLLFLDDSGSVNEKLVKVMDEICRQIPDFYFGRLDIRYQSRELLEEGKSFFILEVNGAGSEPTHMYDPRHSIFFAWKEIIRHWVILFKISRANHQLGYPLSFFTGRSGLKHVQKRLKQIRKLLATACIN